jgi:hypothetical protein
MSTEAQDAQFDQTGIMWLPCDGDTGFVAENRIAAGSRSRRHRSGLIAVATVCAIAAVLAGVIVPPMIQESRKERCSEQIKAIGLALDAYEAEHKHFPAAAICDAQGRPLLSWRVEILPQLGYRSLYERFRRDEPWDSSNNQKLLAEMPGIYACPSLPAARQHLTGYQGVVGPKPELGSIGTLFEWARGVEIREITDGTSNTVAVIEAQRPIPWTQPDDPAFDQDRPLPEFASGHPGGFHAVFADGASRFLRGTIVPQTLRALITRDGNEVLGGG